jgi:acid phosphatase (class A)
MLAAEILSRLRPSMRPEFLADAKRIARNREIAGVHYPSDSSAGASLARQFLVHLEGTQWFEHLMNRAREEWPPRTGIGGGEFAR